MNTALSDTILYVTGKQGIENVSTQELESIIAEYPYFAPAQLVYATKLKSENSFKLQTQTQKAGLFFNNFKWLQYQLMEVGASNFKPFSNKDYAVVEEKIVVAPVVEVQPVLADEAEKAESKSIETNNTVAIEASSTNFNEFMPNMSIPSVEDVKGIMSGIDDRREVVDEELINTATKAEEPIIEDVKEASNNIISPSIAEEPLDIQIEDINEKAVDSLLDTKPDIHAEIAALKANWHNNSEKNSVEPIIEEVQNFPSINSDLATLKNDWNKPAEDLANQSLPFETEPYYTIDYFASQGIKFDYSKDPNDKLTSKMLRFTDWLKKMKTVKPEHEDVMSDDPELNTAIQNIASMSNQTKEVVTETMAEIFAKQGKTEKAIQLYIKLSFLIPDKSAYFATQIKELKGI
jgi:hypothetical protein